MLDKSTHEENKAKLNDLAHHADNMQKIAEKVSKLNKGQLKKIVDDEFIIIMSEYGVEL